MYVDGAAERGESRKTREQAESAFSERSLDSRAGGPRGPAAHVDEWPATGCFLQPWEARQLLGGTQLLWQLSQVRRVRHVE